MDRPAGRCFGRGFPRIAQGLGSPGQRPEHPVPDPMLGVEMGARGSPRNERPSPPGMNAPTGDRSASGGGWVGWRKNPVRVCTTGPEGDGEASHEEYLGLAAAGITLCRGLQEFRPGYGRHPQPVNPRPMPERQESPCFSSNRSTTEPMIGSGKIHMVDTAVESSPGGPRNNNPSRFRPERAFSYPFLPTAKGVPVMRNPRGIHCSPGRQPWEAGVGGVGCLLYGGEGDEVRDIPE